MRKAANIFGIITTVMILLGVIFKMQHWPGAGPLIVFGVMFYVLGFLPLWMIVRLKETPGGKGKTLIVISFVVLLFFFIALLFKVQHWPGGSPILVLSALLAFVAYLPLLFANIKEEGTRPIGFLFTLFIVGPAILLLMGQGQKSNNLLNSFVPVDQRLKENHSTMEKANDRLYDDMEALSSLDAEKAKPFYQKAAQLKKMTDDLDNYIKDIRVKIISETEKIPTNVADTIPIMYMYSKNNYDIPTWILIGDDPAAPRDGEYSAKDLKEKIESYRQAVSLMMKTGQAKKRYESSAALQTGSIQIYYGFHETWETGLFYHMPLAAAVTMLDQLRVELRYTEGIAISEINYETLNAVRGDKEEEVIVDSLQTQNP
jgi:hypothetical protein